MDPIEIHGEAIAGRRQTVRRTLIKLTENLSKHTFDAASLLYEVQKNKYYLEWGYESLGKYATAELNLKERKAQYLSRIVRVCTECGINRADYEPAGVTKLRIITSLDPETTYFNQEIKEHESMAEHITDLVASAPELDTAEVEERVAHLKGMDGENAMVTKSYSVTFSAYENTVKVALEAMRKLLGSKGRDGTGTAVEYPDGACIEYICREFLNDPRNFMEASEEQVYVPTEESNVQSSGASVQLGSQEVPQDTLQRPRQPFNVPTEI